MNISRPFVLRPVATSLLMVALLIVGLIAYRLLPVSALPQVDYPTIQVTAFYPGASPEVIASGVTAPLERQFGQMPGLKQMTSSSSMGSSLITLQFNLDLSLDIAEQEVQAAINAAATFLPRDLPSPPVYSKVNPADTPVLSVALTSESMPLPQIHDFADTRLAQKISQLPGVGQVSITGGQRPAVRVQVNPTALANYDLGLEDVRTAIGAANVNQAKGSFDGPQRAFTIASNDQLLSSRDYRPLVIAWRNGAPVRLSDIADVIDDAENVLQAAWFNQHPAVILNVQRQPGANVIEVADRIKRVLPQLQAGLPGSIQTAIVSDRTTTIRASVHDVQFDLLLAVALVVAVIFVFLRNLAATAIPAVAVPLSLIGTFAFMYLAGFSLDNLSLMALTIATGFVVDDAIVMIENIARYVEQGECPLDAALKGAQQIGFTIISLTVSLIAVLIPLLFMGDVVGRLFREFAVTLSVTILLSAIVSLTLTPTMSARLLRRRAEAEHTRFYRIVGRAIDRATQRYATTLQWVLDRQAATLAVAALTLAATIALYVIIPKGFFPAQDTGTVLGISEAPQSVSFANMAQRQQALVRAVLEDPAVQGVASFIGVDGSNATLNSGRMLINLRPLRQRQASAARFIDRLQRRLAPANTTLYLQPVQDLTIENRVSRTQYQYTLEGADANELGSWSERLVERLSSAGALRDVASDRQDRGLQAMLTIDRATASRLGITPQLIVDTLYDAFGQRQVSTMFTQLNQYRVVLEVKRTFQKSPASLSSIYLRPPTGGQVPLTAVASVTEQSAPLSINRQDQFPVVTLSFNLAQGASLSDAVRSIETATRDMGIPPSIQAGFQGAAAAFRASLANEPLLILAAVVTVYIVLGVLYESYIHPLTILSTLPSAGMGALLALLLTGNDFSVIALIGVILLIGIVMKNAIMMIDFALDAERGEGKAAREAIYEACLLRFRPIVMTTLAALLGALPLALGGGVGAELRRPLGISIIGGLIVSQLLTLYTTPVIYLALDRVARSVRARRTDQREPLVDEGR